MRTVAVVTVGRSDFGIYLPVLRQIQEYPDLNLYLIASSAHLSPEFGSTVKIIEAEGFEVSERIETLLASDSPQGITKSLGLGLIGFGQLFARFRPDILVVLGDRFDMYAAALAALPFKIPVAHIHGGEVTRGAIDDAIRHSLTKLSHLHFVSTQVYADRVLQLGEEPWRVTVAGAPALDNLNRIRLLTPQEIQDRYGIQAEAPFLLVTFHPITLEYEQTDWQVKELMAALATCASCPIIFTMPNADTGNSLIRQEIESFSLQHPGSRYFESLGTQGYFSLMKYAAAMIGNSSSGIIEAPSFRLPVVNIGSRQEGRVRAANVMDVGYERSEIARGIQRALDPAFCSALKHLQNPYGDGHASERIVDGLRRVSLDARLIQKSFVDHPWNQDPVGMERPW